MPQVEANAQHTPARKHDQVRKSEKQNRKAYGEIYIPKPKDSLWVDPLPFFEIIDDEHTQAKAPNKAFRKQCEVC